MVWTLAASAFTAAALAFMVEPMVVKLLLPTYGGSSAVWTTALVFFQGVLVAGYAWAHVGLARLGVRRHAVIQVVLVAGALISLPVAAPPWARPPEGLAAALWVIASLTAMVGLPFLALSTNGPTVQRWLATTGGTAREDPYRLFAASNAGSLVGLLAYPTVVGPNLDMSDQTAWWAAGFVGFVALTVIAAWKVRGRLANDVPGGDAIGDGTDNGGRPARIGAARRARWLAFAAMPAALLVGVTSHLSTDVAAVPLLWVVPLAIYLASLILAYAGSRPFLRGPARLALVPVGIAAALSLGGVIRPALEAEFALHLALLGLAGLALHGALAADRPPAARLTEYNLTIALGGALGGLVAGILGPLVLPVPLEEQITLVAVLVVAGWGASLPARGRRPLAVGAGLAHRVTAIAIAAILVTGLAAMPPALATARSFYGAYRVVDDGDGRHVLYAGTTIHGIQDLTPGQEREPWSYYARSGPIGQVLETLTADPAPLRIGVVGLGTGALAAYGRPGDRLDFLEIDPTVVAIAQDARLFTYLAQSQAEIRLRVGDGRLLLEASPERAFDLVVLDAFSSDSVPVHLLTVEGLEVAVSRVRTGGVVAIHISNRYLDLEPVVAAGARALGLVSIFGATLTPLDETGRSQASQWIVIGRSYADLAGLVAGDDWRTAHAGEQAPWTDRWSDLLGALRQG